jgi:hypothetical protein
MAPEQAGGFHSEGLTTAARVGPAADIYALGAIFYELLTGRPPFRAETPLDTVLQVVSDEPVPPSRLQPRLPRDAQTICLTCLAKDPRRRYASALALAEDLRRFQTGEPIQARPTPAWERAVKWARRRPAVAALWAVSILAVAGLLLGAWWSAGQLREALTETEQERDAATAARKDAEQRKVEAEGARRDLEHQKQQLQQALD